MSRASVQLASPSRLHRVLVPLLVSTVYLGLSALLIGFKPDQLFLACLFSGLYLATDGTRRWVTGFAIFFVYWVLFDWMKAFPNYAYNTVHIGDLYMAERSLFGVTFQGAVLTPNEWWAHHTAPVLDLLAGLFYLCWVPVPLAFAAYLFAKDKDLFLRFSLSFLLVNLLGFLVYYLYPAAPPWYVSGYGTTLITDTPGDPAGLARFDALTGTDIFQALYGKSSNVFAAMPSLHAAYLPVAAYWAHRAGLPRTRDLFLLIAAGIWWSAVYTRHHYLLDILMGIVCAAIGIILFNCLSRVPHFTHWFDGYHRAIATRPRSAPRNGYDHSTTSTKHHDHVTPHH